MSVEGVVAMQACARIGATTRWCSAASRPIAARPHPGMPAPWPSPPTSRCAAQALPLKAIVDEALADGGCDAMRKNVFVFRAPAATSAGRRAATCGCMTMMASQSATCEPEWVEAEHPLFLLYTSGSTGKPKGVQHSTGGYLLHAALTTKWTFDLKGRATSSGAPPTSAGSPATPTSPTARWPGRHRDRVRGVPTYPDAGRFWKMIQDHKVTIFYTAPTAIRSLDQGGRNQRGRCTRRTTTCQRLRLLGSVGEPINPAGLGVVPPATSAAPLPHRRHLLADRDRRPHDHAAAGRDAAGAGLLHAALPGHPGRHRR